MLIERLSLRCPCKTIIVFTVTIEKHIWVKLTLAVTSRQRWRPRGRPTKNGS